MFLSLSTIGTTLKLFASYFILIQLIPTFIYINITRTIMYLVFKKTSKIHYSIGLSKVRTYYKPYNLTSLLTIIVLCIKNQNKMILCSCRCLYIMSLKYM